MTVRDLLEKEIDIDVYDDVFEELGIAFCGPQKLTEEGKKEFAEVLEYPVTINPCSYGGLPCAIIGIDDPEHSPAWEKRLEKAKKFFYSMAGYCSVDDYDKWFEEG